MDRTEIIEKLNVIFNDVFDRNNIKLREDMTANDVEGWDSLTHITLISEIEFEFDFQFTMKEVTGMKNIGEMVDIIKRECECITI